MKQILPVILVLYITGCAAKKWDKDKMLNECLRDYADRNEKEKIFTPLQLENICNCITDKLMSEYKTPAQADKDGIGMEKIGYDCAIETIGR